MRIQSICLTAALLLCSTTLGYAQGGPPDKEQGMQAPRGGDQGASRIESRGGGAAVKEDRGAQRSNRQSAAGEQRDRPTSKREAREDRRGGQADKKATAKKEPEPSAKQAETREEGRGQADRKAASEKTTEPSAKQAESRDEATKSKKETDTGPEPAKEQKAEGERKDTEKQARVEEAKEADISGEKRDKVRSAFRGLSDVKQEAEIDVDVSIGTRLPSHLHFHSLPVAVIEIVPEYRDFVFVYVEDRYFICDPYTYEVVAIIDETSEGGYRTTAARDGEDACSTNLTLTRDERELLLSSIELKDEEADLDDLRIGLTVPETVEVNPLPDRVLSRVDKLAGCQYFVVEDQIALVNPDDEKVVLLVEVND